MKARLIAFVARLPVSVQTKFLVAFLTMVLLMVLLGALGLIVLGEAHARAEDAANLERKVAAYRQLQNDVTSELYGVSSALLSPDDASLEAMLRQLNQFGYDFDHVQFIAADESDLLQHVQSDYTQFSDTISEAIRLVRKGDVSAAHDVEITRATPIAERLQRSTDQLVNRAEADMLASVQASQSAYESSRWLVIGFAVLSIALALVLGYAMAWSVVDPVRQVKARLAQIANGDFGSHVHLPNRDELGALATDLNTMSAELGRLYAELETANRHKSQFLASMSHELRTPLNAIIGFSDVLLGRFFGPLNDKQAEYVSDIRTSGGHLVSLINDILDLAKVEAGRMDLVPVRFSVRTALENGLIMVRERAARGGVALQLDVDPGLSSVCADERKFKQVVFNLLANAVKFTPSGGCVSVSAVRTGGELRVAVMDTGVGIAPEDHARIFDEFQQVVGNGHSFEGTGLGLALSRRLVELHGGRIWVESEVGHGSTFVFALPLT